MFKICYVEDEKSLNNVVTKYLENSSYEVYSYNYPKEVDFNIEYDLYILDIMFENDISGYELFKIIKDKNPNAIIIFTSARDNDIDRIKGLELGSDDYLAKPFSPKELVLRCNLILKRYQNKVTIQNTYKIDLNNNQVYENDSILILTTKEYEVLKYFIKNKNKLISRDELHSIIWNYEGNIRVVDDLIRRLRQKMPSLSLETVYGKGYQLIWKKA